MLQKSKGDVGEGCSRFRKHNMQYVDHPGECIDESVQCSVFMGQYGLLM